MPGFVRNSAEHAEEVPRNRDLTRITQPLARLLLRRDLGRTFRTFRKMMCGTQMRTKTESAIGICSDRLECEVLSRTETARLMPAAVEIVHPIPPYATVL